LFPDGDATKRQLNESAEKLRQIEAMYAQVEPALQSLRAELGTKDTLVGPRGAERPPNGVRVASN